MFCLLNIVGEMHNVERKQDSPSEGDELQGEFTRPDAHVDRCREMLIVVVSMIIISHGISMLPLRLAHGGEVLAESSRGLIPCL